MKEQRKVDFEIIHIFHTRITRIEGYAGIRIMMVLFLQIIFFKNTRLLEDSSLQCVQGICGIKDKTLWSL